MTLLPEFDLTDKVVFITGAGRGIGSGIAEVLAEAGANIALNALTPKNIERTVEAIEKKTKRRILTILADVTKSNEVNMAVEKVLSEFGRIDVLINNLGDAIHHSLVKLPGTEGTAITDEQLKHILDINMMATVLCTRVVGPYMLEQRAGKIINISSFTARRGGANVAIYSLAKAAVVGFTRTQALEWAPYNVHINSIAPGLFPEPMDMNEERLQDLLKRVTIPLQRTGQLREVGYLALYLASSASDYMTGQTLYLDGGITL
ncbi:SDR family NAD(P)-dependent oxidoreductase [Thermodesulfobacteriota bacterium]